MKHKYTDDEFQQIVKANCVEVAAALNLQFDDKRSDKKALHVAERGGFFIWRDGSGFWCGSTEEKGQAIDLVQRELSCSYTAALDFIHETVLNGVRNEAYTSLAHTYKQQLNQKKRSRLSFLSAKKELAGRTRISSPPAAWIGIL